MSEIRLKSTINQTASTCSKSKVRNTGTMTLLTRSGDFTVSFKQTSTHCFGFPLADFEQKNVHWGGRFTFKGMSENTNTLD